MVIAYKYNVMKCKYERDNKRAMDKNACIEL